jgi:hypothetical protein
MHDDVVHKEFLMKSHDVGARRGLERPKLGSEDFKKPKTEYPTTTNLSITNTMIISSRCSLALAALAAAAVLAPGADAFVPSKLASGTLKCHDGSECPPRNRAGCGVFWSIHERWKNIRDLAVVESTPHVY